MQLTFEEVVDYHSPVVNVANVPQRSPFRYAGGKSWLIPRVRQWLNYRETRPYKLVEPFAGGASVSLTSAFENLVDYVTLVELDNDVAAVWETIIGGDVLWLAHRLRTFALSPESAQRIISEQPNSRKEEAFRTILRNRVNHGGILAPGVGMLKTGEKGKGISSRWYPETLAKRIEAIAHYRTKLRFIQGDGLEVMANNASCSETVFFIDPPYTVGGKKAGSRLYAHSELDHEQLFNLAAHLRGDFLMTYDNTDEVHRLALKYGFQTRSVAMKNTHHAKMTELLIGKNLNWVDN